VKKITVLGWYGHGNAGDESYKTSFPLLFPQYQLNFTDSLNEDHRKNSDAFILGGGAVMEPAFLNQLKNIKKDKYIISVTANKNAPIELLKDYKKILVRDVNSQKTLNQLGVINTLMPDLAFLLRADKNAGYEFISKLFQQEKHELYEKIVVIVYNAHLGIVDSDKYLAREQLNFLKVANDIADIADNTSASFVFVPFGTSQPWDDRITNSWLASKCKFWKKNIIIFDKINFQQLINIIASANAVISTRLHASIFSCIAGVPFIDITHHDKNLGFLSTINKTDWSVSYWRFDSIKCSSLLNNFLNKSHTEELKQIVEKQQKLIKEVMNNVHIVP
jgi:polysaccharide pyruvyl transferase WcaK-like protein